ncbi:MAG: DUF1156 domain-containing protein [candidate division WS1 bacterium]|nr:DUF1156 domain-containing protein [candidate division WS1 bacterium]
MTKRKPVLIEQWLPVRELGIESQRERGVSSALPPLYFLHVWWARRPLTASRAAILGAALPADTDHTWFRALLGIQGDVVAASERIREAKRAGVRLPAGQGYEGKRAFSYGPDERAMTDLQRRIEQYWGRAPLRFLDPMSGGGSIPFEAMRFGFETWANELNPVASVVLKATLDYPARYGEELIPDIRRAADKVHDMAREELERFYPAVPEEDVYDYIWAHTVKCPGCGVTVPLSPNWWLERAWKQIALRPVVRGQRVDFEIVHNPQEEGFDPREGTVRRGVGLCPACDDSIAGEHIKAQAQGGQMGFQLVALVIRTNEGRTYRLPSQADLAAVQEAEEYLQEKWAEFEALQIIPDEIIYEGNKTQEPLRYGMKLWRDMFTPRQLLSHLVYARAIKEVGRQLRETLEEDRWQAVMTYLTMIFGKGVNHNARMARWESTRGAVKGTFDRHDFAFKWSFAEMQPVLPKMGAWPWGTDQILDAYKELSTLAAPYRDFAEQAPQIQVTQGNAATYRDAPDGSVDIIVVDPPYYDNVMYAECSDFFYVWQKRLLGEVFPHFYSTTMTDKQQEAVANVALFEGKKGARKLARSDYEGKMRAAFRRLHGLLADDGVMVVMFTHKQTEAWDALAMALIEGGWEITASWPVHTESEHSLHQAKRNAARSTIFLVCRKREGENDGGWWGQVRGEINVTVKQRVTEYEALGIRGVDLMLAAFGPALQVLCRHWPVKLPTGEQISAEDALDQAREVVRSHRWLQLVGDTPVDVDPLTQFVIYAWDFYRAEQIRFDEAHKLYMGLGVDMDELRRRKLVRKSGAYLLLIEPLTRARDNAFDPEAPEFDCVIDALHAALWWYEQGGLKGVETFMGRTRLHEDSHFLAGLQAYLRALPAVRPEFQSLREIADSLLHNKIDIPPLRKDQQQMDL